MLSSVAAKNPENRFRSLDATCELVYKVNFRIDSGGRCEVAAGSGLVFGNVWKFH
jgi:hypothetical protein